MKGHSVNKIAKGENTIVSLHKPISVTMNPVIFTGRIRPLVFSKSGLFIKKFRRGGYSHLSLVFRLFSLWTSPSKSYTINRQKDINRVKENIINIYNYYNTGNTFLSATGRDNEKKYIKFPRPHISNSRRLFFNYQLNLDGKHDKMLRKTPSGNSQIKGSLLHAILKKLPFPVSPLRELNLPGSPAEYEGEEIASYLIHNEKQIHSGVKNRPSLRKITNDKLLQEGSHSRLRNLRVQNHALITDKSASIDHVLMSQEKQMGYSGVDKSGINKEKLPMINKISFENGYAISEHIRSAEKEVAEKLLMTHRKSDNASSSETSYAGSRTASAGNFTHNQDGRPKSDIASIENILKGPSRLEIKKAISEILIEMNAGELRSISDTIYRNFEKRRFVEKDRRGF